MTNNERRLLKDLPFDGLKRGDVLKQTNGGYCLTGFSTYYSTGGSSSSGTKCSDGVSTDILDTIWENTEWFEPAELKHIDIVLGKSQIALRFEPISAEKAETLARGIQHIIKHLDDGSCIWNGMGGVTTQIKNN